MAETTLFPGKYGHFTGDGREYVITDVATPRPWVNVMSNGDYTVLVSQTGSGYSWRGNAGQNRITRAFQDLVKNDGGKYVYIRDLDGGEFWSATWKPVMEDADRREVRFGPGYSVFLTEARGIRSELTVFAVPGAPVEIMDLVLTNLSSEARRLDVTAYLEWVLGHFPDEHREFHKLFIETSYDAELFACLADKYLWGFPDGKGRHNNVSWPFTAFLAASEEPKSWDTDKESFLGMYGSEARPAAMSADRLGMQAGRFGDAVGALCIAAALESGASRRIVFSIGAASHGEAAGAEHPAEDPAALIRRYTNASAADEARIRVDEFWSEYLDAELVETPDEALNLMTNTWLKYQAISGRLWGKSGYYQTSAGFGYRDQLQDSQIFLPTKPELTRRQILLHAAHQFSEGDVLHWWFTIRGGGPRTKCSDDLLWLPFITSAYLEETADYSILDESVPFLDGGDASLYEHCRRAIEKSFSRFSPRGVPLMGDNDWNDGLSAVGTEWKGESFWVGQFLYLILGSFAALAESRKDGSFADRCRAVRMNLADAVNLHGWDGQWYLQATTDDGEPVGSSSNDEGRIFLNPQIWAVISGIAPKDRAKTVMGAVTEHLLKDYGTLLLAPAYTRIRTDIGYITRYAPGLRENGGVYTHAATWSVWAYALLGDAERAWQAYSSICPPNRAGDADAYLAEPYVTPGNSDGPLSPLFGRGGWTWYTGSAAWLQRVATHWILGVRPEAAGLRIDPLIPAAWEGFRYHRRFRGHIYHITVTNPSRTGRRVAGMTVDGKPRAGNLIPAPDGPEEGYRVSAPGHDAPTEHHVEVVLG